MHQSRHSVRGRTVWGERLKQLRLRRGWTQQELAHKSGYCERLIRKAELNGSVSDETLEILALTLSDNSIGLSADDLSMSSRDTLQTFRSTIDSADTRSLQRLLQVSDSEIEIDCRYVDEGLPLHGMFIGHEGLVEWHATLGSLISYERVTMRQHVLLDGDSYGYYHSVHVLDARTLGPVEFEMDMRLHLAGAKIRKIVLLSGLSVLNAYLDLWNARINTHYQNQIVDLVGDSYANRS